MSLFFSAQPPRPRRLLRLPNLEPMTDAEDATVAQRRTSPENCFHLLQRHLQTV